jgi:hypothetical protein
MKQNYAPLVQAAKPPYSWSVGETSQLLASYEAGWSIEQLARWSGRSPHHVVVQLAWAMCGVGRDDVNPMVPRFREPWSDEESTQLVQFIDSGLTLDEVSYVLGRDLTDVAWHMVLTRKCHRGVSRAG